jgi:20S proteasome subunit alpha 3
LFLRFSFEFVPSGLRPFGVSFLFAGWDEHFGFQLYQSDPSGNYGGWKATAIGANSGPGNSILKADYKLDAPPSLDEACKLALKVLGKTMDTATPTSDKLEFVTVTRDQATGRVVQHTFDKQELEALLKTVNFEQAASGDI